MAFLEWIFGVKRKPVTPSMPHKWQGPPLYLDLPEAPPFTAAMARATADEVLKDAQLSTRIEQRIRRAAAAGNFAIAVQYTSYADLAALKTLGYTVELGIDPEGMFDRINWFASAPPNQP